MPLCSLCKAVWTDELPPLSNVIMDRTSWLDGHSDLIYFLCERNKEHPLNALKHHPSLEALSESAKECQLCGLIYESAQTYIEGYREKEKDPSFEYYYKTQWAHGLPEKMQVLVCKNRGDRDGFFVLTSGESRRNVYLLAAVGFCADEGTPMSSVYTGRPVEEDGGSTKVLDRATAWIEHCITTHPCGMAEEQELPSRLLDIAALGTDRISLCDTRGLKGRYAALSHQWGDEGHFTTSRSTLEARKQGIEVSSLPILFQNAVMIARHLGMRYLWVDALCICQDDIDEWARESAVMTQLYSHAYVVIAADSSIDGTQSMLHRDPPRYVSIHPAEIGRAEGGMFSAFLVPQTDAALGKRVMELPKEPLSQRAWALQERALPRRTLHFTSRQMFFECTCEFSSEDGCRREGRHLQVYDDISTSRTPTRGSRHSKHHALWYAIVKDYTGRRLSKTTDKLPALSGLAHLFKTRIGCDYIAGLWKDGLIEGLSWQGMADNGAGPPKPKEEYLAPSWSWIAYEGPAATGSFEEPWEDVATVLDWHITLKTANPYGEISDGRIKIRAPLVPLRLSDLPEKDADKLPSPRNMRLCTPEGDTYGRYSGFDDILRQNEESRAWVRGLELSAMVLSTYTGDNGPVFSSLLVAPTKEQLDGVEGVRMERLGHIFLSAIDAVDVTKGVETIILV